MRMKNIFITSLLLLQFACVAENDESSQVTQQSTPTNNDAGVNQLPEVDAMIDTIVDNDGVEFDFDDI